MSEEVNQRIGDYQILNELGSGGMGRVYRVRNVISDRIEAMKVLLPDLAGRQELAARFLREIKVLASLNHPNIAALRTALTVDNQLIMIMEYVEGTTIAERLEHGPISVPDALNYIGLVLSALNYAHQQGVVHRDIKPANMMLTPQGVVKLMDFGIARANDERSLTMTGTTLGSLSYMSPEQVTGEGTDARSDLYSVGVSLYEMVTGQRPFQATSDYSIMAAHVKSAPRPPLELQPGLPSSLNDIILIAIAKDPAERFQTAEAFRNALSNVKVDPSAVIASATSSPTATTLDTLTPPAPVPTPASAAPTQERIPAPPTPPTITPPVSMPPPAPSTGHRGLYMTLGALIVLAVLVAAGIYIPRHSKTQATTSPAMSPETPGEPGPSASAISGGAPAPPAAPAEGASSASPAASTQAGASAEASGNLQSSQVPLAASRSVETSPSAGEQSTPAKPAVRAQKMSAKNTAAPSVPAPPQAMEATTPQPAAENNTAQLDELEHEVDQLSNRAAAVDSSLDNLQRQQNAAGYGLRSDMVARQASMKNNLSKAQSAVEHGDVERAKKFMTLAQGDVEALEHFLGH